VASQLRSRDDDYKSNLTHDFVQLTKESFKRRDILPIIDRVFPLSEVEQAHRFMEADGNIGKIILRISEEDMQ